MSTQPLEAAIRSTRSVLININAADLGLASPCASWKVSDVINHVVGALHFFGSSVSGESLSGEAPDFSAGDFVAAFDEAAASCVAAFNAPGAMDKMLELPFGTLPGSAFIGIATSDTFTHGWDLAKATGQSTDLDPELAAGLLPAMHISVPDSFRGDDGVKPFGPAREAGPDATNADLLAAFLGRAA